MKFEEALTYLKKGQKLRRSSWQYDDAYIQLYKNAVVGIFCPLESYVSDWIIAQEDILADDWHFVVD